MKITILGSGGFGFPLGFCNCNNCENARNLGGKNLRKRASILINDELIIDLTPDCQTAMQMYNKDMGNVKYLLQTHSHLDHFDVNIFNTLDEKYSTKRTETLHLICSKLCLDDIQLKASKYDRIKLFNLDYLNKIKLNTHVINHGECLNIADYQIKAIYCEHDNSIGAQLYLIKWNGKTLFYATDTPMITEETLKELSGETLDCVILDHSFGDTSYSFSHLNKEGFKNYINVLKENDLLNKHCKIFATHITHDGNPVHEEMNLRLSKFGCNACYDGQEIII